MSFPYGQLREEKPAPEPTEPEYELMDTGIFDQDAYFDIFIEYVKATEEDILVQLTIYNRAKKQARIDVMPSLWFRNTWYWGYEDQTYVPNVYAAGKQWLKVEHQDVGNYHFYFEGKPELLFCENETNRQKLFHQENTRLYPKDSINDYVISGNKSLVNPQLRGTKSAVRYTLQVVGEGKSVLRSS